MERTNTAIWSSPWQGAEAFMLVVLTLESISESLVDY